MTMNSRKSIAKMAAKPLITLVIEDDTVDFALLEDRLGRSGVGVDCRRVETEAEFVAQLKPGIDLVLCDYQLPGWNAMRALELFRASRLDVPFIVISGAISEEVAVECMKQGASDYLLKDRLGRLGPAITRAIAELAERRQVASLSTRLLKAHEEERKNIAHELHDNIEQGMAVLLMELHRLDGAMAPTDCARGLLTGIVRLVESHAAFVRDIGLSLRPSMLDDLGLIPALSWQARDVSRRTGMKVTVDSQDTCNLLTDDYRTCIYRLVQEALHNAARHAKAANVHVTVREGPAQVRVEIQDDGCGFDARYKKGTGILGMEERARHLGGVCQVESQARRGARISILLPSSSATAATASMSARA